MVINGQKRAPCVDGNVLYLDCINVNILVVILCYILYHIVLVSCYYWGKLGG